MKHQSFEERHRDNISRLKLVLIVVCLIAIPVTFYVNHHDLGSVSKRVTHAESPCVRYGPKSRQCKVAFELAVLTITHPEACAILRKAGLEIRHCAGARLRQEQGRQSERDATVREWGDAQNPAPQGQQPGPSGGHQGQGVSSPAPSAPAPSPRLRLNPRHPYPRSRPPNRLARPSTVPQKPPRESSVASRP